MKAILVLSSALAFLNSAVAQEAPKSPVLPQPGKYDGKPADMSKPVKVFIMMGQSNMLGMGNVKMGGRGPLQEAVHKEKLYPFLIDESGAWVERKDVRNVSLVAAGKNVEVNHNEWLKVGAGFNKAKGKMGVEYSVGHLLGNACDEPVLLLKCCIGNRSLGWDLLPPGSRNYDVEITGKDGNKTIHTYAGYKESPQSWVKGSEPVKDPSGWHAGIQYDLDTANAKKVLADLDTYCPGASEYEIAGFFWWQGEKDAKIPAYYNRYEQNLVHLIKQLRADFNAPGAKFVLGTMGEAKKGVGDGTEVIMNAHLAVDGNSGKYPEFKGNVSTVYTHDMARGGGGNGHYGKDSRVYMDVGLAMGDAMLKMLNSPAK